MSSLWITVEAQPGSEIIQCCKEAVALANQLQQVIWFNFNSVKCLARPGDNFQNIADAWSRELNSKHTHPIASDRG